MQLQLVDMSPPRYGAVTGSVAGHPSGMAAVRAKYAVLGLVLCACAATCAIVHLFPEGRRVELYMKPVQGDRALHEASAAAGASANRVNELAAKAETAKKKAEAAEAAAAKAEKALKDAADADDAPRQQKGFISGDRFGEHHVWDDFGINHNRRRGNWGQRHYGETKR